MSEKAFVKVTWHDARDDDRTWVDEKEIQPFNDAVCEVTSWGYLVAQSKLYVTLAADYMKDGVYGRVTKVPRKMIVTIEEFKTE
jgi:hypothetical protein